MYLTSLLNKAYNLRQFPSFVVHDFPMKEMGTSNNPFIRFVGYSNSKTSEKFLPERVAPAMQWLDDGLKPYCFIHMPDDLHAPRFGRRFVNLLTEAGLDVSPIAWPCEMEVPAAIQTDLF